jgi:DnaJ-class molecular chaperone
MGLSHVGAGNMLADTLIESLQLETVCQFCDGSGEQGDTEQRRRCVNCKGAGHVPTKFGEKVLALMRHNFRPLLQDATER